MGTYTPANVVASFMDAWIEIIIKFMSKQYFMSHPLWMRGLKSSWSNIGVLYEKSHPLWMRGLKSTWTGIFRKRKRRILYGCVD